MPPRKHHASKTSRPGTRATAKGKSRLVSRVARGALLAVSFTAMQFFTEEGFESKRLFDHRVVDNLQAPLTRYHE